MGFTKPLSKKFSFDNLISENNICQSWLATDTSSEKKYFLKVLKPESQLGNEAVKSIFINSFISQRKIKSDKIITAQKRYTEDGFNIAVYPYLDENRWQPLTPELFGNHFKDILCQICLIIDYLHFLELVHCDLKLDNFLVDTSRKKPEIVLTDLDFLCNSGTKPKAKIFGSPEHVAPEILANDTVIIQSDNFSLGISLLKWLEFAGDEPTPPDLISEDTLKKIRALSEKLTEKDPLHRPRKLIEALHQNGIIEQPVFESLNKSLLTMLLLTSLREAKSLDKIDEIDFKKEFLDKNKILGFDDELTDSLVGSFHVKRTNTFRAFKTLIDESGLEHYSDYWHVTFNDKSLFKFYAFTQSCISSGSSGFSFENIKSKNQLETLLKKAKQFKKTNEPQKSFLLFKEILETNDRLKLLDDDTSLTILRELAEQTTSFNRMPDAARYYDRILENEKIKDYLEILHKRAEVALGAGHLDKAKSLADKGIEKSEKYHDARYILEFKRYDAWIEGLKSNYKTAEDTLESVYNSSVSKGFMDIAYKTLCTSGIMYWRKGQFKKADGYFIKSVSLANEHRLTIDIATAYASLSLLYFELAEYRNSIKYGRLALKRLEESNNTHRLVSLLANLSGAYSRIGEHRKAEYYQNKSMQYAESGFNRNNGIMLYLHDGFIKINAGRFKEAKDSLYKALELFHPDVNLKSIGKVYHDLAEIAFYQGQSEVCHNYCIKTCDLLKKDIYKAAIAEVELIGILNNLYYNNTGTKQILSHLKVLIQHNCHYYAALCLFHILINATQKERTEAIKTSISLMELTSNSEVPLFRAISLLIGLNHLEDISSLKSAYNILETSGSTFPAMMVCKKIADIHKKDSKDKLAVNFMRQALKLAESMDNELFIESFKKTIEEVSDHQLNQKRILDSIYKISDIFRNIQDYNKSLQKVVEFAVDQTGAERGVLLLKKEDSSELKVKAFINCDEESLKDVRDFSTTIPMEVSKVLKPLVIDNALEDKRTKKYKSIILHNIRSVICLPISLNNTILGALYLDHHTIPALFDDDDIIFVSSIANFIAVMLVTIQKYRNINIINQQLIEEMNQLGEHQSFITKDATMEELFNKLPEIARTNVPILILGESGTGKEIICQMIHNLSFRSNKPLLKLNCAAIATPLIESELFGIAKNVATNVQEREGKFSAADGGTLFIDEIGDMPVETQAKVLRVLEYQQFDKVGSNRSIHTDIRFIYATNKDLIKLIKEEKFRQDLYYRINTITIEIPPLRERRDDIALLIEHFLKLFSKGKKPPVFSADALEALILHDWPGNVRQLRNVVERCCILYPDQPINRSMLPVEFQRNVSNQSTDNEIAASIEKAQIRESLIKNNWVQSKAADELKIPLSTLRRKIKKYNIIKNF